MAILATVAMCAGDECSAAEGVLMIVCTRGDFSNFHPLEPWHSTESCLSRSFHPGMWKEVSLNQAPRLDSDTVFRMCVRATLRMKECHGSI